MSLFIYLLRRSGRDDRILVRRTREGFRTEQLDGESRLRQTRTFAGNDLYWQLSIVIAMMTTDILPFQRVQLSAPGQPSIMQALSDLEAHAVGWHQFAQVIRQFIEGAAWVTESRAEVPSGRSDGTDDEGDAHSVPGVLPSVPRWVP